jgi:hypothetical protein
MRSMTCSSLVVALIGTAFQLTGCTDSPISPSTKSPATSGDAQIVSTAATAAERDTYRIDVPFDWVLTPAQYPCLTEAIHLSGTYQEHLIFVANPSSGFHITVHQTTNNITVVGLTTGDRYRFSGPLTFTANGSTDQVSEVEFTLTNINHFIGPGQAGDIYLHTLLHVTFDPATGAVKAEVFKDEVLCH